METVENTAWPTRVAVFDPPPGGVPLPTAGVIPNQVTFLSFPDGFTLLAPEPIDFHTPPPSVNVEPEIGIDYYDYIFANVDGVLTFAKNFTAQNYAVCYYIQRPWNPAIGGSGGDTPWYIFAYDAITGTYLNPAAPLLVTSPAGAGTDAPYPVNHPGAVNLPAAVNCLQIDTGSATKFSELISVTAARTGDTDKPAAPLPFTTYTPDFTWFVMPFGNFTDYKVDAPSAAGAPLGGTITLGGSAGGIVQAVYGLSSAKNCALLYKELNADLGIAKLLQSEINTRAAGGPGAKWPTTVWPLEAQLANVNQEIAALEAQLAALGCPGFTT